MTDFDAVVVGASLAGCATAIHLGRAGHRVALVDKRPDPAAYKRVCGHFIQSSAIPALERLGVLEELEAAGAVRGHARAWSPYGWFAEAPAAGRRSSLSLRREKLDPLLRRLAAATPGVELRLGSTARRLLPEGDHARACPRTTPPASSASMTPSRSSAGTALDCTKCPQTRL